MATIRQRLHDYFVRVAAGHREDAYRFGRDRLLMQMAWGLEELADYVLTLPEADHRLTALALLMRDEPLVFDPESQLAWRIRRFRAHVEHEPCAAFLGDLAALAWPLPRPLVA